VRRRRVTALVGAVAVVLAGSAVPAGTSSAAEDGSSARYVVLMAADPIAAYEGGVRGLRGTSPDVDEQIRPRSPAARQYTGFLTRQRSRVLRGADVERSDVGQRYTYALNGFAADLTKTEVVALRHQRGVVRVVRDRLRRPQTDNTPQFLGLSTAGGPWSSDIVGEDVVVGVIDTGIWPEHPSFADDGTFDPVTLARPVPCEFGGARQPGSPADPAFACNNKLLGARDMRTTYKRVVGPETYDSARDDDGHGTHTASTAAGNSEVDASIFEIDRGQVSGVAPRARVVAYKACGEQGCFESDLMEAIDTAVADGVDVINYSIGGGAGLAGPDEIAFLNAATAGVFAATSAGNTGPGEATVGGPSSAPWVTSVGASTQDRAFEGAVRLGDGTEITGASITDGTAEAQLVDAAALGNELCLTDPGLPASVTGDIVLCKRGTNARVEKSQAVFEAGGAGMVLYDVSDAAALVTDNHWVPSVHISNSDGLAVKEFVAANGNTATAQIIGGERVQAPGSVMADFSSRGPNPAAPDIIKPDITAPGVNVLAGNSPTPALGAPGQLFQSISGTSMSSPHVAGIYALLKQAHPDWTPAMAKSAVMTSARQDVVEENGTTAADPFDFGAGHVAPGSTAAGSMFDPGLVYDATLPDYVAFLCGSTRGVVAGRDCRTVERLGFPSDPRDLNYPSIGVAELAGTETVTRRLTSVAAAARTFTAAVDAPAGFDVSVSPAQVRLTPGETQPVEITVSNAGSAPVGQWRFGSLTWTSGTYSVRSPIAVAASAFDAPDEAVRGNGRRGRAAFDVQFGYSGAYDARPHPLTAQRSTPGRVAQDPDQTFDPADPTGTTAHRFRMQRTAYMRWELTHRNSSVDLDMYLYDQAGQEVASSTSGGTDELIEARLPRNGVYTLYVHGWQTVATPRESYRLRSWEVPQRTRGTLRVVRAPDDAVISRAGRVQIAWNGLRPSGAPYFGVVSHHRGGNVLGLTVVRVTPGR
jgi:subtilisin family serine protease